MTLEAELDTSVSDLPEVSLSPYRAASTCIGVPLLTMPCSARLCGEWLCRLSVFWTRAVTLMIPILDLSRHHDDSWDFLGGA